MLKSNQLDTGHVWVVCFGLDDHVPNSPGRSKRPCDCFYFKTFTHHQPSHIPSECAAVPYGECSQLRSSSCLRKLDTCSYHIDVWRTGSSGDNHSNDGIEETTNLLPLSTKPKRASKKSTIEAESKQRRVILWASKRSRPDNTIRTRQCSSQEEYREASKCVLHS